MVFVSISCILLFFEDDNLVFLKATQKGIDAFKDVLRDYEMASGQRINLDKSAFMGHRNVINEAKRQW